ncbi:MAG TPA: zf-HC2 domain-containing protein [Myxococcota bacterium]|nr:zf-HC2 domain-containing protein [Myxococcota bacterium]
MTRKLASVACPQVVMDWIAWYPDGELADDVRGEIEAHAAECAACRQEIADLSADAVADAEPLGSDAERVFLRVKDKIERSPRRAMPAPRRRLWTVRPRFAVAAGLAVALVSGAAGVLATQQLAHPIYGTATAGNASDAAAGAQLSVVFRDDASMAEVSSALLALGANVEHGPSPRGVVQLRLAAGADPRVAAERLERGDLRVAAFAQPIP